MILTIDELWCLHKFLRHPKEEGGQEFSKDFMLQVYQGISHFDSLPIKNASEEIYEIFCDESDLWQITRMVEMDYNRGGMYIGFSLLTKAILELVSNQPLDIVHKAEEILKYNKDSTVYPD